MAHGAGTRWAFAHYFTPYPVSLDTKDPANDYYTRAYLNPTGESGIHAAYGGVQPGLTRDLRGEDLAARQARRRTHHRYRGVVAAALDAQDDAGGRADGHGPPERGAAGHALHRTGAAGTTGDRAAQRRARLPRRSFWVRKEG